MSLRNNLENLEQFRIFTRISTLSKCLFWFVLCVVQKKIGYSNIIIWFILSAVCAYQTRCWNKAAVWWKCCFLIHVDRAKSCGWCACAPRADSLCKPKVNQVNENEQTKQSKGKLEVLRVWISASRSWSSSSKLNARPALRRQQERVCIATRGWAKTAFPASAGARWRCQDSFLSAIINQRAVLRPTFPQPWTGWASANSAACCAAHHARAASPPSWPSCHPNPPTTSSPKSTANTPWS